MSLFCAVTRTVNLEGGDDGNGSSIAFGGLYLSIKKIELVTFVLFFNLSGLGTMEKRLRSNIFGNNNTIVLTGFRL
jgi:hypothetical protein